MSRCARRRLSSGRRENVIAPGSQVRAAYRINVVVRLRLSKGGKEEERKAVIAAGRKACEGLARYEKTRR